MIPCRDLSLEGSAYPSWPRFACLRQGLARGAHPPFDPPEKRPRAPADGSASACAIGTALPTLPTCRTRRVRAPFGKGSQATTRWDSPPGIAREDVHRDEDPEPVVGREAHQFSVRAPSPTHLLHRARSERLGNADASRRGMDSSSNTFIWHRPPVAPSPVRAA